MNKSGKDIIVAAAGLLLSSVVFGQINNTALAAPGAPIITWPTAGMVLGSNQPDVIWTGSGYDSFEVHICGTNDPNYPNGWDSGVVLSTANTVTTGYLTPQATYYVFVRLGSAGLWSGWSAYGNSFYIAGRFVNEPIWLYGSGQAWNQDIAYNPERNEYLLVFFEMQSETWRKISYLRLDGNGTAIGDKTTIYDDNYGTHAACVTYNSMHDEYLIAYTAYRAAWYGDLMYAQRVNANTGELVNSPYCIHNCSQTSGGLDRWPSVAYSPTSDTYLVAWGNEGNWKVYGALLSGSDGHLIAGDINITPGNLGDEPAVCWNSAADEFYVAYQAENGAYGTGWDIAGQRVNASNGAILGNYLLMANSTDWEWQPDVAYDSINNRYLVVYGGAGYVGVWGQLVTPANTFDGPRFSLLAPPLQGGAKTFISYQAIPREFLVTWGDQDSAGQYGRRVSQSGIPVGQPFRINGDITGETGNFDPVSAANTVSGEYLICFSNDYTDLYTRRYQRYPLPGDNQPPDPVTNLTASRSETSINLIWTNPSTPDFSATMIRVKAGSPPVNHDDGELVVHEANRPGTVETFTDTGRPRGTPLYYSAFAHDLSMNYAEADTDSTTLVAGDFDGDDDVDQEDFGRLQACFAGSGIPYPADCDDADFDLDTDVDQADFASFSSCLAGPNQPPACEP